MFHWTYFQYEFSLITYLFRKNLLLRIFQSRIFVWLSWIIATLSFASSNFRERSWIFCLECYEKPSDTFSWKNSQEQRINFDKFCLYYSCTILYVMKECISKATGISKHFYLKYYFLKILVIFSAWDHMPLQFYR